MDSVLNWLWQGCVVGVASFVTLLALDRARAHVRYAVCWAAMLLTVALPVLPSLQSMASRSEPFLSTSGAAVVSLPDAWWTSTLVIAAAWTAWAVIGLVRLVWALIVLRRARTRSQAFPSSLEARLPHWSRARIEGRHTALVLSDAVTTAAVLGCGAPAIAVAPSLVRTLDPAELDRVLIHEWAHVQRRDDLVNILQIIIRTVAGWHPAVWWLDRRLHIEREIACDEMTVAITGSPKSYAHCLLKLASLRGTARGLQAAPAVLVASGLRARITKIVAPRASIAPRWSRGIAVAAVSGLCAMSLGVGELELVEATAFALPFAPSRTIGATLERFVPVAVPVAVPQADIEPAPRRTAVSAPPAARPATEEPSPAQWPEQEPQPNAVTGLMPSVDSPQPVASDTGTERVIVQDAETVPPTVPPEPSRARVEPLRTPWAVAADGGTTLGRKSRDAGVATAGFFSRFARRVAGSF